MKTSVIINILLALVNLGLAYLSYKTGYYISSLISTFASGFLLALAFAIGLEDE